MGKLVIKTDKSTNLMGPCMLIHKKMAEAGSYDNIHAIPGDLSKFCSTPL